MQNSDGMNYELLIACYRSGQIPEAAWQEHLRDEVFAQWLAGEFRGAR